MDPHNSNPCCSRVSCTKKELAVLQETRRFAFSSLNVYWYLECELQSSLSLFLWGLPWLYLWHGSCPYHLPQETVGSWRAGTCIPTLSTAQGLGQADGLLPTEECRNSQQMCVITLVMIFLPVSILSPLNPSAFVLWTNEVLSLTFFMYYILTWAINKKCQENSFRDNHLSSVQTWNAMSFFATGQ